MASSTLAFVFILICSCVAATPSNFPNPNLPDPPALPPPVHLPPAPAPHPAHGHHHHHHPPTKPPSHPPTKPPSHPPTKSPVSPPVKPPVSPPTKSPVSPPAKPPVSPPTKSPVSPPVKPPVSPPKKSPVSPPAKPPVSPPAHSPVSPPAHAPAKPPSYTPQRKLVGIRGMVYCKACKYRGVDTLSSATPILGAVVELKCKNSKYPLVQKTTTDKNGYFIFLPKLLTTFGVHKCNVTLVHSPLKNCTHPTNLHGGVAGALPVPTPLPAVNNTKPAFMMYSLLPFAFEAPKKLPCH